MKEERCPRCGALLQGTSAPCPECGYEPSARANENDLTTLDSAFGDFLKEKENDDAIVKKAKSMERSDPLGAITLYRKALLNRSSSAFARPYFSFLVFQWKAASKKKGSEKEREQLFQGYRLLKDKNALGTLAQDEKLAPFIRSAEKADSYQEILSYARGLLAGPLKGIQSGLPANIETQIDAKYPPFEACFAKIAILSCLYEKANGEDLEACVKSISHLLDIPFFLSQLQDPLLAPHLKPFLDFYFECAGRLASRRFRPLSFLRKGRSDEERERIAREEKDFLELNLLNKREAKLNSRSSLDWMEEDNPRKALESLRKGKGFWLRNIFIQVLHLGEKEADVAFIFPYPISFDRRALSPIAYGKPGFMDKWKKKPIQDGKLLLRSGSVPPYEISEIRLILNEAIWNELPPGLECAFRTDKRGDRFSLISKSDIDFLEKGNFCFAMDQYDFPSFWLKDPSPKQNLGLVETYCPFITDGGSKFGFWLADERFFGIARSTLDIQKFEEWEESVESYFGNLPGL